MRTPSVPSWLLLQPGETLIARSAANHSTPHIAAGGWLALTDRRLVHHTHGMEKALTETQDWAAPLFAITMVDTAPVSLRGRDLFTGGLRRRLRVTTQDGMQHLFVVNGVSRWVDRITTARSARPS